MNWSDSCNTDLTIEDITSTSFNLTVSGSYTADTLNTEFFSITQELDDSDNFGYFEF